MISCVKHASIPVKDQDIALEFYTKTLGFELENDMPISPEQQRWIELRIPKGETRIVLFTPEGHEERVGTFSNIIFSTENIEATYEELKERGVKFYQDLTKESWGTFAVFCDPDGNSFCLSESR